MSAPGVVPAPKNEAAIRELNEMLRRASERNNASEEENPNQRGSIEPSVQHRDQSRFET